MLARWTALCCTLAAVLACIVTYETHGLRAVAEPTVEWRRRDDNRAAKIEADLMQAHDERTQISSRVDLVATQAAEAKGRVEAIEGLIRDILKAREPKPDAR